MHYKAVFARRIKAYTYIVTDKTRLTWVQVQASRYFSILCFFSGRYLITTYQPNITVSNI